MENSVFEMDRTAFLSAISEIPLNEMTTQNLELRSNQEIYHSISQYDMPLSPSTLEWESLYANVISHPCTKAFLKGGLYLFEKECNETISLLFAFYWIHEMHSVLTKKMEMKMDMWKEYDRDITNIVDVILDMRNVMMTSSKLFMEISSINWKRVQMNDKIGELIHMLTCHDDKVLTDDDEVNEMWDVSQISEIWSTYWWMWMDRIVHVPADAPDIWICITRCIVATKNEDVLQEMWLALKTLMANKQVQGNMVILHHFKQCISSLLLPTIVPTLLKYPTHTALLHLISIFATSSVNADRLLDNGIIRSCTATLTANQSSCSETVTANQSSVEDIIHVLSVATLWSSRTALYLSKHASFSNLVSDTYPSHWTPIFITLSLQNENLSKNEHFAAHVQKMWTSLITTFVAGDVSAGLRLENSLMVLSNALKVYACPSVWETTLREGYLTLPTCSLPNQLERLNHRLRRQLKVILSTRGIKKID